MLSFLNLYETKVFEEDVDGSAARPRAELPLGPFNFPRSRPFGIDRLTIGG